MVCVPLNARLGVGGSSDVIKTDGAAGLSPASEQVGRDHGLREPANRLPAPAGRPLLRWPRSKATVMVPCVRW